MWKPPITTGTPAALSGRAMSKARGLVRLYADQRDEAEVAFGAIASDDAGYIYPRVCLIHRLDIDRDLWSENPTLRAIRGDAVQSRQ